MSDTDVVCASPGRKDFEWQVLDGNDQPVNIAGGSARWQGQSADLPDVVVAGCSTNGTTTVSRATGDFTADGVRVGCKISGTNIPAGATVVTVGETTLTISAAASGTAGSLSMRFFHDIDYVGTIADAPNGVFRFAGINALVAATQLGVKELATFAMQPRFTDSAGKVDYGDKENWSWHAPPI